MHDQYDQEPYGIEMQRRQEEFENEMQIESLLEEVNFVERAKSIAINYIYQFQSGHLEEEIRRAASIDFQTQGQNYRLKEGCIFFIQEPGQEELEINKQDAIFIAQGLCESQDLSDFINQRALNCYIEILAIMLDHFQQVQQPLVQSASNYLDDVIRCIQSQSAQIFQSLSSLPDFVALLFKFYQIAGYKHKPISFVKYLDESFATLCTQELLKTHDLEGLEELTQEVLQANINISTLQIALDQIVYHSQSQSAQDLEFIENLFYQNVFCTQENFFTTFQDSPLSIYVDLERWDLALKLIQKPLFKEFILFDSAQVKTEILLLQQYAFDIANKSNLEPQQRHLVYDAVEEMISIYKLNQKPEEKAARGQEEFLFRKIEKGPRDPKMPRVKEGSALRKVETSRPPTPTILHAPIAFRPDVLQEYCNGKG